MGLGTGLAQSQRGPSAFMAAVPDLAVNTGGYLLIEKGGFLTVENMIGANANVLVQSDAGLLQLKNAANSGDITVKREIEAGAHRTQYNYIGSPVTFAPGQILKTIYPDIEYVLYHNEKNNHFYNSTGANIPGRGLAVKEPRLPFGTVPEAKTIVANFMGIPQNGDISIGIVNTGLPGEALGYNLMTNPYPSNIDLIKLYQLNSGNTPGGAKASPPISPTFYFWDNEVNNGIAGVQQGSNYNGQAYAVFNALTGNNGTGTAAAGYLLPGHPINSAKKPTNILKVAQGFMVKSLVANYVFKFNNSIRTSEAATAEFFGKGGQQDDRYWLQMISPLNVVNTIAIVHYEGGSNARGPEDSESRGGSDELFSLADGMKAAINGRATFSETDIIPLGSQHFQSGSYRIKLSEKEGRFASGQPVYLKDQLTGRVTNLSEGDYFFAAEAGETAGRFAIVYLPGSVLSTESGVKETLVIYRAQNSFHVKSSGKKITQLQLFDASGRLIKSSTPQAMEAVIDATALAAGVYVVKIERDGEVVTKKIVR